jgi:hypothetical protein
MVVVTTATLMPLAPVLALFAWLIQKEARMAREMYAKSARKSVFRRDSSERSASRWQRMTPLSHPITPIITHHSHEPHDTLFFNPKIVIFEEKYVEPKKGTEKRC